MRLFLHSGGFSLWAMQPRAHGKCAESNNRGSRQRLCHLCDSPGWWLRREWGQVVQSWDSRVRQLGFSFCLGFLLAL